MQQIVGVKFRNAPKVYYFSPAAGEEYPRGSTVIVETAKGLESGTVVIPLKEVEDENLTSALKPTSRGPRSGRRPAPPRGAASSPLSICSPCRSN